MPALEDLLATSAVAASPSTVEPSRVEIGGVDPLGLRQINFDLMDQVLPGLNNVADRLRPFVVVAWAWRRVAAIVKRNGLGGATDQQMRDFVDRIEAIYAWSQFLIDDDAGIPGRDALAELISGPSATYQFSGKAWEKRRDMRRTSTGLISPLNYGPGLRSMGWLIPIETRGVFVPNPALDPMLDAFEEALRLELDHPAFTVLGSVEVAREDARRWGNLWAISNLTEAERRVGFDILAGPAANAVRREGLAMIEAAAGTIEGEVEPAALRALMARSPKDWLARDDLHARADSWRRLQIRQLLRLSLEGLFHWMLHELQFGPAGTAELSRRFVDQAGLGAGSATTAWLSLARGGNSVDHLDQLAATLDVRDWPQIPACIADGLHFCLTSGRQEQWNRTEAPDRLPLSRALGEATEWESLPIDQFFGRIVERWVVAQHAYWCVGRGLADARGGGKVLLRLRIVMDEGGWTLTRGSHSGGAPVPTRDRLETAINLLRECGRLQH